MTTKLSQTICDCLSCKAMEWAKYSKKKILSHYFFHLKFEIEKNCTYNTVWSLEATSMNKNVPIDWERGYLTWLLENIPFDRGWRISYLAVGRRCTKISHLIDRVGWMSIPLGCGRISHLIEAEEYPTWPWGGDVQKYFTWSMGKGGRISHLAVERCWRILHLVKGGRTSH